MSDVRDVLDKVVDIGWLLMEAIVMVRQAMSEKGSLLSSSGEG
jgi:hypothetical protein